MPHSVSSGTRHDLSPFSNWQRAGAEADCAVMSDFFFSSRRRHTRSTRDWSSDVCSSDLVSFETPTNACTYFGPLSLDTYYYVTITVTNAHGDSESLTFALVSTNDLPSVYAGPNVDVFDPPGTYTTVAEASDPQSRPLSYQWTQVSGPIGAPLAAISDATALNPTITVEQAYIGVYVFQLTASNGRYATASEVTLTFITPQFQFLGSFIGI